MACRLASLNRTYLPRMLLHQVPANEKAAQSYQTGGRSGWRLDGPGPVIGAPPRPVFGSLCPASGNLQQTSGNLPGMDLAVAALAALLETEQADGRETWDIALGGGGKHPPFRMCSHKCTA